MIIASELILEWETEKDDGESIYDTLYASKRALKYIMENVEEDKLEAFLNATFTFVNRSTLRKLFSTDDDSDEVPPEIYFQCTVGTQDPELTIGAIMMMSLTDGDARREVYLVMPDEVDKAYEQVVRLNGDSTSMIQ